MKDLQTRNSLQEIAVRVMHIFMFDRWLRFTRIKLWTKVMTIT